MALRKRFVQPTGGETAWYLSAGIDKRLFETMLAAFARESGAGRERIVVLVLDNAGWHTEPGLAVPDGTRLVFLPPYSPEPRPAERLWPLVDGPVVNRHFATLADLDTVLARRCRRLRQDHALIAAHPLPLRPDYDAMALRALARRSKDAAQSRRPLALAAIYDGGTRSEAAQLGSVALQIVRDWVLRFNAEGPAGLIDRKAPGQPPRLTEAHRAALVPAIEAGPVPPIHGVVRWRLVDLGGWLWEEFRVSVSKQTLSRELRAMGYRKLSARPRHHAQAEGAVEAFKKASPRRWTPLPRRRASPARP